MEFMTTKEAVEKWNISEEELDNYYKMVELKVLLK